MNLEEYLKRESLNPGRTYSRSLLGATIAPNLEPCVLKKILSLEMVKNDVCKGVQAKKMLVFQRNVPLKTTPVLSMSRIGPVWRIIIKNLEITCSLSQY